MTKTYRRELLMALNKGALITADFVREPDGNKKVYRLSSTGRAIRTSVVEQMVDDELIRPYSDGLPGLGGTSELGVVAGKRWRRITDSVTKKGSREAI